MGTKKAAEKKKKTKRTTSKKPGRPRMGNELVKVYAIRMPDALIARLNALAAKLPGATPRALARECVEQGIIALEKKLKNTKLRA